MKMLAVSGVVFHVDAESPEEAEKLVNEHLVTLLTGPITNDRIEDMKVWTAAEFDTDARDAGFKYKDLRSRMEPEYGLTPNGKKALDERLKDHAEKEAAAVAEQIEMERKQNS